MQRSAKSRHSSYKVAIDKIDLDSSKHLCFPLQTDIDTIDENTHDNYLLYKSI